MQPRKNVWKNTHLTVKFVYIQCYLWTQGRRGIKVFVFKIILNVCQFMSVGQSGTRAVYCSVDQYTVLHSAKYTAPGAPGAQYPVLTRPIIGLSVSSLPFPKF